MSVPAFRAEGNDAIGVARQGVYAAGILSQNCFRAILSTLERQIPQGLLFVEDQL